ncbi:MAG: hypothetical protein KF899_11415 [Parvibaculum sp.]|nr:hypothetical protein [Parvibaculum sp.]
MKPTQRLRDGNTGGKESDEGNADRSGRKHGKSAVVDPGTFECAIGRKGFEIVRGGVAHLLEPDVFGAPRAGKRVKREASECLWARTETRFKDKTESGIIERGACCGVVDAAESDRWLILRALRPGPGAAFLNERLKTPRLQPFCDDACLAATDVAREGA